MSLSELFRSPLVLRAFDRSFAIIEFDVSGNIKTANANFLSVLGYGLEEVFGKHHSLFCEPAYAKSNDYREFWDRLRRGEFNAGEFRRIGKGGREVWIQASYCPIVTRSGKVTGVVKLAADITASKMAAAENQSVLDAVSRSQATISFSPAGEILDANDNFLAAMGYQKQEIVGHHHRMFVDPAEANSPEYGVFWSRLAGGDFVAQEFRRIGKGGREVWIQAAYNPVFDANGRVVKVVKIATDLSERMASIGHLADGLNKLAQGDLTAKLDTPLVQTMEALRRDFNGALSRLDETMHRVGNAARGIHQGTQEIALAADDLSKRTEQQASSLEQTAAALDQITATGKKASEGAVHARSIVTTAASDAEAAGQVVRRTVDAMSKIERSAAQITQIIGVIDEIAFQTNLLALNAGVEAARAGDAGRGFAVVASEVRALAQRSAGAAKEIKGLISTSAEEVSTGVALVAETGTALSRILEQVKSINAVVMDIASGAEEQATGLTEVNTAVNQMDQVTQQNAAMVEQSTAAGHALRQEADALANLIGQFKIGRQHQSESQPPKPVKRRPSVPTAATRGAATKGGALRKPVAIADADADAWSEF